MDELLWGVVLIPAASSIGVYLIGRRIGKRVGWIALVPLMLSILILLSYLPDVAQGRSRITQVTWIPEVSFGLLIDGLSLPIVLTVAVLSALITVYSITYMEHRVHEEYGEENKKAYGNYFAMYLLYAASMMGVVLSTNLFEFYLFYELMIIPSWALINAYGYGEKEKIALMYLLWAVAGAVLSLTGILIAHANIHSFEISSLAMLKGDPIGVWVVSFILIGFFVKMAVFGLHIWLPYAHAEAPTPISALLSPAMIGLATYATVRMLIPIGDAFSTISLLALPWAMITIVYGGLMALTQNDIKRLLAYSSISQMGYLLLGIASNTSLGVSGSMLHYISHGLGKATLFLVAGAIIYKTGIRDIRQLGGLASKMPISTTTFIIGFMTIAGIPPTVGFISKWLMFAGAFQRGLEASLVEMAVVTSAMIATVLTIVYMLWAIKRIFYGPLPSHLQDVEEAPTKFTTPLLILSLLSLLLGVYPKGVLDLLMQTIQLIIPI